MKAAKSFQKEQQAIDYIARKGLETAKIIRRLSNRSDPRYTTYIYVVAVENKEYFEKVYYC